MRIGWIGGGLGVIVALIAWGRSSNVTADDPAHRAALETRLKALQTKKAKLEEVPGSLEEQRHYQARIDVLSTRLGHPIVPFAEEPKKQEKLPPSLPSRQVEDHDDVDFFHDRSQVVRVKDDIAAHGGIHPHSSLLEELPQTHPSHRQEAPPLRRGVIIDGGDDHHHPNAEGKGTSQHHVAFENLKLQSERGGQEKSVGASASLMEPALQTDAAPPGVVPSTAHPTTPIPEQHFSLPQTGMPPPLWTQAKSHQDYNNKAGWSATPPPINNPLFSGPFLGSAALVEAAAQQSIQQDPRFSFPPNRLMNVWPQR